MIRAYVNTKHIAYRRPFHVERFKSGLVIGCDAGGLNCVRFDSAPNAIGTYDPELMTRAVEALNQSETLEVFI